MKVPFTKPLSRLAKRALSVGLASLLATSLSLVGCSLVNSDDDDDDDKKPTTTAVSDISFDESELYIEVNNQAFVEATVRPDNATNSKLTWTSSNTSIATVEASEDTHTATIKGVAIGSGVVIKATAQDGSGVSKSISVDVVKESNVQITTPTLTIPDNVTQVKETRSILLTAASSFTDTDNERANDTIHYSWKAVAGTGSATITVDEADTSKATLTGNTAGTITVTVIASLDLANGVTKFSEKVETAFTVTEIAPYTIFAEDFDNLLEVAGISYGKYIKPSLVTNGSGHALIEDASAASGYRGGYTGSATNPHWGLTYTDGKMYTIEFDLSTTYTLNDKDYVSKFYVYNGATSAALELQQNPPVVENYVWGFGIDGTKASWVTEGTLQHYKLVIAYSSTPGASTITAYCDGKSIGTTNDVGGGDIQGILLMPGNYQQEIIDNIVIKAEEAVTPAVTVTAEELTGTSYVPTSAAEVIRLSGSTAFTALESGTDVSSWFTTLPANFTAKLDGAVAAGGIRAKVKLSGMLKDATNTTTGTLTVTVPADVLTSDEALTDSSNTIAYELKAGAASVAIGGQEISEQCNTPISQDYTITLTNNSFVEDFTKLAAEADVSSFITVTAGQKATNIKVTLKEAVTDPTKATITVALTTSSSEDSGNVSFTLAANALADNTVITNTSIAFEFITGAKIKLIVPADATSSFSVSGTAATVDNYITVIGIVGAKTAVAIAANADVATFATITAKAVCAVAAGAKEIPVYFSGSVDSNATVTLSDSITLSVEATKTTAYNASSVYQVYYAEDFENWTDVAINTVSGVKRGGSYCPTLQGKANGATDVSNIWVAQNSNYSALELKTEGENIFFNLSATTSSGIRWGYSLLDLATPTSGSYVLEFDAALTTPDAAAGAFTISSAATIPSSAAAQTSDVVMQMVADTGSTTWKLYDGTSVSGNTVTLTAGSWYHYKLSVAIGEENGTATLSVTDATGAETLSATSFSCIGTGSAKAFMYGWGKNKGSIAMDNIVVYGAK